MSQRASTEASILPARGSGAGSPEAVLLTRLLLQAPTARSFLFAPVRRAPYGADLAARLATVANRLEHPTTFLDLRIETEGRGIAEGTETGSFLTVSSARRALDAVQGLAIVGGVGLIDDPFTIVAAVTVDAVVIVARRGKTARSDVVSARVEVERAGGTIAAAVMLD